MSENLHGASAKSKVFVTGERALKIGELPLYHSPYESEQPTPIGVQIYALTATPSLISLPVHKHITFENLGANPAQYAESSGSLFVDFISSGQVYAFDFHNQTSFWLRSTLGTSVRIIVW